MKTLKQYIKEAERKRIAIGHFNVSDLVGLKGVFEAAYGLGVPVIIGVSEGEAGFWGVRQIAALIKSLAEEYRHPIFLNADHTHSLDGIKKAAEAGFDAVLFDASHLHLEENIKQTRKAVLLARKINPHILIEGELGQIAGRSTILKDKKSFAIRRSDLTKPEEAVRFIKETGIDLLAPSVGNIHGMFQNAPNPAVDADAIREIKERCRIPLVLHGGSGIPASSVKSAIAAGISIVHINTELRLVWRKSLESALKDNPDEIVPYKILPLVEKEISKTAKRYLKLFN